MSSQRRPTLRGISHVVRPAADGQRAQQRHPKSCRAVPRSGRRAAGGACRLVRNVGPLAQHDDRVPRGAGRFEGLAECAGRGAPLRGHGCTGASPGHSLQSPAAAPRDAAAPSHLPLRVGHVDPFGAPCTSGATALSPPLPPPRPPAAAGPASPPMAGSLFERAPEILPADKQPAVAEQPFDDGARLWPVPHAREHVAVSLGS